MRLHNRYIPVEMKDHDKIAAESERHLFDRILKYTGVFGSVQGVSMLVTLVINMVKSRLLGPVGYGITESLNRNADLVRNSTNLGIATAAVPVISTCNNPADVDARSEKIELTRSWALLTAILGMVVCVILAPLLSRWAFNGDSSFTVSFMEMSVAVAATAVTGGETAVLRGTGKLRQIALSQLFTGLISLCVSVPLYWFMRIDGIVPALAVSALGGTVVTCLYSCRSFPYKASPFSWRVLRKGTGMIGFGIFFTVAAFLGAWAWSIVAKYLTGQGGSELTGTYSAGYMLVTYLSTLLLSVTESEYYPRLSASCSDMNEAHRLMNSQSLAMCMLAAPLVMLFMLCVPIVVFIVLEYEKFRMSIPLAQISVIGLFFKSIYQPIAFVVLARSDSIIYLIQETVCNILLVVCVVLGYRLWGTMGIGVSLAIWELMYLLQVLIITRLRYGFCMSKTLVSNFLKQGFLVLMAAVGLKIGLAGGYAICIAACAVSIVMSIRFFSTHSTFIGGLLSRFRHKF